MDQIYKNIVSLQHKCKDWIDEPTSGSGRSIQNEVQRLEDAAQVRKNPKTLEDQARSVIKALERAGDDGAMSHNHVDELVDRFEDLIQQLRKI